MRNIPRITRYLLIANIVAFFAMQIILTVSGNTIDLNKTLGLHFVLSPGFNIYQLFTYMFMHGGFTHLFFNMFALWMFGCVVENTIGEKKFLFYYILCGIGAGLFQEVAQFADLTISGIFNIGYTVGASGSIYGILLAFGMLYPEQRIFIFPLPVPIKAKYFIIIYAVIELLSAMGTTNDGVAHVAHLGGMVVGFFLLRYWKRPKTGRKTRRNMGGYNKSYTTSTTMGADWTYNQEKKRKQAEVDAILDKIRKSGYDSLTKEEKQRIFDASK